MDHPSLVNVLLCRRPGVVGGWAVVQKRRSGRKRGQEATGQSNARHAALVSDSGKRSLPFSGYALRRVTVAPDLDALRGPFEGRSRLPLHLDASTRALYDFASPSDRELAYQLVLLEAGSPNDHEEWLARDELLGLWSGRYLPRGVRAA